MEFFSQWFAQLTLVWHPYFFVSVTLAVLLALLLRRHSGGMLRFTALMLLLFFSFLLLESALRAAAIMSAARVLHYSALLVLGILLVRQVGLCWFRLLIPRFNLHPPRILEELLILLGYVGWTLYLLSGAGLELSSLVTSTAVVTAILAFAMQDTLGNILSGLALQLDQSICLGDWLEFEDMFGEVIQVQWRHTAIMTRFGEKILIPNSDLMKNRVKIIGGQTVPGRYNTLYFYSSYELSPSRVISTVQENLNRTLIDGRLPAHPPVCQVYDFNDGQITYALHYWVADPRSVGGVRSLMWQHIYAIYQRNGWYLSAPNRDISVLSAARKKQSFSHPYEHNISEKLQFLQQVGLFKVLTQQELAQLAEQLQTVFFVEGGTVIVQGQPGKSMFIIVRGRAAVHVETDGVQQCVALLAESDIFGEMSLMTGDPRQATVIAEQDLLCYKLDKDSFAQIIGERPELAESIAELLSQRASELEAIQKNITRPQQAIQKQRLLGNIRRWFGL